MEFEWRGSNGWDEPWDVLFLSRPGYDKVASWSGDSRLEMVRNLMGRNWADTIIES